MKSLRIVSSTAGCVVAAAIVVGVATGASASRVVAAATPSVLTFTDDSGDAGTAPDITNVKVTGDASTSLITFAVTASGLVPATPDALTRSVDLFLNTDRNAATGSPGGNELDLYSWSDPTTTPATVYWDVARWAAGDWQEVPQSSTMQETQTGDTQQFTVSTADLGSTASFSLYATSGAWDANGNLVASDDTGALRWVYDINGPTRTLTQLAFPTIGKAVATPSPIRAGKRVTVAFPVSWTPDTKSMPLTTGKLVSAASIGAKAIAHTQSLANGTARLSFVVPRSAKGKVLKVKVTITPPTTQEEGGSWIDIATGETGLTARGVKGMPATQVVTFAVR